MTDNDAVAIALALSRGDWLDVATWIANIQQRLYRRKS